jgi:hypothetical protein
LQFGQSIHQSDLYRLVQSVEGVRDAFVRMRRADDPETTVREDIFIGATELARLENESGDPAKGLVTGKGGFVDA